MTVVAVFLYVAFLAAPAVAAMAARGRKSSDSRPNCHQMAVPKESRPNARP